MSIWALSADDTGKETRWSFGSKPNTCSFTIFVSGVVMPNSDRSLRNLKTYLHCPFPVGLAEWPNGHTGRELSTAIGIRYPRPSCFCHGSGSSFLDPVNPGDAKRFNGYRGAVRFAAFRASRFVRAAAWTNCNGEESQRRGTTAPNQLRIPIVKWHAQVPQSHFNSARDKDGPLRAIFAAQFPPCGFVG